MNSGRRQLAEYGLEPRSLARTEVVQPNQRRIVRTICDVTQFHHRDFIF